MSESNSSGTVATAWIGTCQCCLRRLAVSARTLKIPRHGYSWPYRRSGSPACPGSHKHPLETNKHVAEMFIAELDARIELLSRSEAPVLAGDVSSKLVETRAKLVAAIADWRPSAFAERFVSTDDRIRVLLVKTCSSRDERIDLWVLRYEQSGRLLRNGVGSLVFDSEDRAREYAGEAGYVVVGYPRPNNEEEKSK